jgi:DNA-binding HxlR family transcriptional regulator
MPGPRANDKTKYNESALLAWIAEQGGVTVLDLAMRDQVTEKVASRRLRLLYEAGDITRSGIPQVPPGYVYSLAKIPE